MGHSRFAPGDILTALFPTHQPPGREQEGQRPAVVVGLPDRLGLTRFATVVVVPLTTDRNQPWALRNPRLYPRLAAGTGGLPRPSIVLLDQVTALDQSRLLGYIGSLTSPQFAPIDTGLRGIFGWIQPAP